VSTAIFPPKAIEPVPAYFVGSRLPKDRECAFRVVPLGQSGPSRFHIRVVGKSNLGQFCTAVELTFPVRHLRHLHSEPLAKRGFRFVCQTYARWWELQSLTPSEGTDIPALLAAVAVVQLAADRHGMATAALAMGTTCTISAKIAVSGTFEDINCLIHTPKSSTRHIMLQYQIVFDFSGRL